MTPHLSVLKDISSSVPDPAPHDVCHHVGERIEVWFVWPERDGVHELDAAGSVRGDLVR